MGITTLVVLDYQECWIKAIKVRRCEQLKNFVVEAFAVKTIKLSTLPSLEQMTLPRYADLELEPNIHMNACPRIEKITLTEIYHECSLTDMDGLVRARSRHSCFTFN